MVDFVFNRQLLHTSQSVTKCTCCGILSQITWTNTTSLNGNTKLMLTLAANQSVYPRANRGHNATTTNVRNRGQVLNAYLTVKSWVFLSQKLWIKQLLLLMFQLGASCTSCQAQGWHYKPSSADGGGAVWARALKYGCFHLCCGGHPHTWPPAVRRSISYSLWINCTHTLLLLHQRIKEIKCVWTEHNYHMQRSLFHMVITKYTFEASNKCTCI